MAMNLEISNGNKQMYCMISKSEMNTSLSWWNLFLTKKFLFNFNLNIIYIVEPQDCQNINIQINYIWVIVTMYFIYQKLWNSQNHFVCNIFWQFT